MYTGNYFEFKDAQEKIDTKEKIRKVAVRIFQGTMPLLQKSLSFESEGKSVDLITSLSKIGKNINHVSKRMFIHGIEVSKFGSMSLISVYETYKHPDNFLYVVFDA